MELPAEQVEEAISRSLSNSSKLVEEIKAVVSNKNLCE